MYLGIDLGTSNSAIAGITDGRVRIFKTPEGTDTMPSVLYRDQRGNQTVGVRAFDRAALAPDNVVAGFKRLMGTDSPQTFASTGETLTPEQAATEVLRVLVGNAMLESGAKSITGTVVTIPAAFNQMQTEATLAASRAAGLGRVALLQEPVAAALAAIAGAHDRSGVFLVYDLGGGTFDAALVHAQEGEVTVLAHEGITMLGGRDLDLGIVNAVALPWLRRSFDLPENLAVDPKYRRLIRIARRSAEDAKIALSIQDESRMNAPEEDVRLDDLRGKPIYMDVPLRRNEFEALVSTSEVIGRSVACCRKMLADAGFQHEDVARVVLIGGPTKMPLLRQRVQDELGIRIEGIDRVDPMTAVAAGAAIYCEGRDWSAKGSTAKPSQRTESGGGTVAVTFEFESRTASDNARLKVEQVGGAGGAEVLVDNRLGWSSGRRKLSQPIVLELPLANPGPNRFRATVFGANGIPVVDAGREIVVERLLAATGGVPATHTIATKILDDNGRNTLQVMVQKGTILPASGVVHYRLAAPMRASSYGMIRIELFQMDEERVLDPALHLFVGEFRIPATDLPDGTTLQKGDKVIVHWAMSEGQTITAEVELPDTRQRFDRRNYHNYQVAQQNFSGEDGGRLAATHLELAERDLVNAEETIPLVDATSLPALRHRLDTHSAMVRGTVEPDSRLQAVDEIRRLRQEIAVLCHKPEVRRDLLRRRLNQQKGFYDRDIRNGATRDQKAQVDTLLGNAEAQIDGNLLGNLDLAYELINEVNRLYWRHGLDQDSFCISQFLIERENRHMARDPAAFDRSVAQGGTALAAGDAAIVRRALVEIWMGQVQIGDELSASERASLMRA